VEVIKAKKKKGTHFFWGKGGEKKKTLATVAGRHSRKRKATPIKGKKKAAMVLQELAFRERIRGRYVRANDSKKMKNP